MRQRRAKTDTPPKLPRLSEKAFTDQVITLARLCGWRVAHFRPAVTKQGWRTAVQGDGAGWPDLILCRGRAFLVVELKADDGKLAAEQKAWLLALRDAGVAVAVWRPRNWDHIQRVLTT